MKKFTYQGKEYDFYYTYDDDKIVELYDFAEKTMVLGVTALIEEKLPKMQEIKKMCELYTGYIDAILGNGTCNAIFGDETTPTEIIKFKNTLTSYVGQRMHEENSATEIKPLNREQRRAKQ